MRLQRISVAAILAVAGLVVAIVTTATVGASGAPARSVLVKRLPASRVGVSAPPCELSSTGSVSAIRVTGVCGGRLTGAFTCVKRTGLLALSIERPFGRRGQVFRLTIVVSDPAESGDLSEAGAVAQITGLGNVSRWSNRNVRVRVGANGSVDIDRSALAPEAGTPATGQLRLRGRAACARAKFIE